MQYYEERTFPLPAAEGQDQRLVVRQPTVEKDLELFHQFIQNLPALRQNYLRYDLTDLETCRARMALSNGTEHWRLVAELDGIIVGGGTLEREPYGWSQHVAELRGLVAPDYNHLGIGPILLHELVEQGIAAGIERLFAEVIFEQKGVRDKLKNEGFKETCIRKDYARDVSGKLHDVVIMSNNLQEVWDRLEEIIYEMDCVFSSGQ